MFLGFPSSLLGKYAVATDSDLTVGAVKTDTNP
jgi:hypothetical protein